MKLHERIGRVGSKAELVEFVRALAADLSKNPEGWENPTLETYLSALAAWLEDAEGFYRNQGRPAPVEPSWRDVAYVAEMLMAAKMYE